MHLVLFSQNLAQTPSFEKLLQANLSNHDQEEILSLPNENDSESVADSSDNEDSSKTDELKQLKPLARHQISSNQKLAKPEQITICIGEPGPLSHSMYSLIRDMSSNRSAVISPGSLFSLVCKKYAPLPKLPV
jgi:hypothetical protein